MFDFCGHPLLIYIEFQNTYKIDNFNDKMNYKDKDQSITILTKSYYTKNTLF
jgi:hypothetical protein